MYGRYAAGSSVAAQDNNDLYSGFDGAGSSSIIHEPIGGYAMQAMARGTTAMQMTEDPRPMTSVKGAGYKSNVGSPFDPVAQTHRGKMAALKKKIENGPEFVAKEMEREINQLIVESATAKVNRSYVVALDKAKEAVRRERLLVRHCEQNGLAEHINVDLSFATQFNLAVQYTANDMMNEALNIYTVMVKTKQFANAGRLRVNMGNIYYKQKKYPAAIKMYRMAMDLVGATSKDTRYLIMRNIGNAFVRLGQFQDAIQAFESIMDGAADSQTGFNLVVCYFALGDKDKMKKGFLQLLMVPVEGMGDDKVGGDLLSKYYAKRQAAHSKYVLWAAKLIAPVIEETSDAGFQWLISHLKSPKPGSDAGAHVDGSRSWYERLSMELELCHGISFLKQGDFPGAMAIFRSIERQQLDMHDQAACNLSFLYFLEGDYAQAKKYADMAVQENRYNASALVNRGNVHFVEDEFDAAQEMYLEAIGVEADCTEAVFNLALVYKQLGKLEDALGAFRKLHNLCPKNPEIISHIADIYDLVDVPAEAAEWYKILLGLVPTDGNALARLGRIACKLEDQTQALHCFTEAYQYNPVSMEVISWLGVWYVKSELYESAILFFQRAAEIEPGEIKWKLMVASCYRRMGAMEKALQLYKRIHSQEPDSVECLRYLCSIYRDTHQDALYEEYAKKLERLDRKEEPVAGQEPVRAESATPTPAPSVPVIEDVKPGAMPVTSTMAVPAAKVATTATDDEFDAEDDDDELLPM
ncbi:unnamed protein product (mitochondrion) [Plasmodiophora brassicae]|uniref:Intraflagellar transport protein 88 n=1 Tax=Plasmodiophora brassicae TaxID=37360 RepID=A0A0G4J7I0_PLABS|nr:hypothetical protein PBRA_003242 [Plasmodiophora brassicae]SPQ95717.1 unnamed protein product [Plasmodiophora brassicae]